jgi:PAS domain S-box-containing protein
MASAGGADIVHPPVAVGLHMEDGKSGAGDPQPMKAAATTSAEVSAQRSTSSPGAWTHKLQRAGLWAARLVEVTAAVGLVAWLLALLEPSIAGVQFLLGGSNVLALAMLALALRGLRASQQARQAWRVHLPALVLVALGAGALALGLGIGQGAGMGMAALAALLDGPSVSVGTASCYLLLGTAMMLATLERQRARDLSRFLAIAVVGVVLVALVGLTFRLVRLDVAVPALGMALPVALALLAASISLAVMRPAARLVQLLESDSPGALIVRRLIPMAVGLPLLVAWTQTLGVRAGWFESVDSGGVLTVVAIVAGVGLILWMSGRLDEMNLSRFQAERRADTERQWLNVTLANIGDAVITVNDQVRISFMNPAAEALLGVPAAAAVGRSVSDLLTLVDGASGQPLASPLEGAFSLARTVSLEGEPTVQHPDGRRQAVEVTATPSKDDRQRVIGGVMVLRDVSAHRAREHAEREAYAALDRRVAERTRALDRTMSVLRESTTLLRTIAASTPELIVAKSRDGRIMMVNPAALQAMGLSHGQVMGRKDEELFGDTEETRRAMENDRRVIETGRPVVVEEQYTRQAEIRTYLVTKSPLCDSEGQVFGLVGVAKDITERKRAQQELEQLLVAEHRLRGEAERANRAKDEFLAIVSHELRSPLNALKGWSQVLLGTRHPEPTLVVRAAEAIKRNIDHQTRLIDDLLDTARIISGKLELHRQRVNLVDVIGAALDQSYEPARAKRIDLSFSHEDEEAYVEGDFDRLQQVLSNLLSNAVKFTPEGGQIQVRVAIRGESIELAVADTGIGIDADFLPYVFDRFSQADTSMTRRYLGLGIGLALVRNLVELHDGTVQAESPGAGQGSVFTVSLPRALAGEAGAPEDALRPEAGTLDGVTAFVVDDDPDAREVMRLMLRRAGAQVQAFQSSDDLMALWQQEEALPCPAVLLLDIAMPSAGGFELLRRIRQMGRMPEVPAIAVTALTYLKNEQFSGAGFMGKVGKPVDEQILIGVIEEAIRGGAADTSARS